MTLRFPTKNTVAYQYLGEPYPPMTFPDVKPKEWYFSEVEAAAALDLFRAQSFDLVLLDIMLPKIDASGSARRSDASPRCHSDAHGSGRRDAAAPGLRPEYRRYVTKPFSMPVLLEKIRVILRRSGEAAESRLHYRDLVVDLDTREAALDGRPLDLTAREFELLRTFLAAPGRVFTREMLLSRLWGYDFFGDERVVDSHIKNLRHKLGRDYIETVRGVGYRAAKEDR